ncbi:MAG TPA: gamma carbonic anhydrase family protein [Candidatus Cybelea sp.]|nr:gamma carbonic anhydrase family protein [Candidatus Cybelea sp.]
MPFIGPDVVLDNPAFVHPSVHLYGKVRLEANASIWCNAVVRSESHEVVIGPYSNVQDFVMIHVGAGTGTYIGSHCSITHHCTIHGCSIGDNCLIGINATIMDGCEIGENCIVAGHTFLRENTKIPANSVVMGVPGEVRRTENNYVRNRINAFYYYRNALAYARGDFRAWDRADWPAEVAAEIKRLQAMANAAAG